MHRAEVGDVLEEAEPIELEPEKPEVEIDVVGREHAVGKGTEQVVRHVRESGGIDHRLVGDAVDLGGRHPPIRVDQGVEHQTRR